MIVLGLLGISAGVLVELHGSVVRGIEQSEDISVALTIANQKAEEVATMGFEAAPGCRGPAAGCRVDNNTIDPNVIPPDPNGFACTRQVESADIPAANMGPGPVGGQYRVDTTVDPHPDPNQPNAQVVTISVCWQLLNGQVRQVQAQRMVVSGA